MAAWDSLPCTGTIKFTAPGTYTIAPPSSGTYNPNYYANVDGSDWTFDATGVTGVVLKAKANQRLFYFGGGAAAGAKVTFKGLTIQGSGNIGNNKCVGCISKVRSVRPTIGPKPHGSFPSSNNPTWLPTGAGASGPIPT